ncbi:MAG: beta-galactosidase, partial [Lentisphaeraceae bacterium]|nr:beta-galactosidase [Lentisphaeraceae bacterium]
IEWMLAKKVSFNVYMLHGGTNWGFTSGANWSGQYSADTTSYDYDAPIDEMGRITDKFYIFRDTIKKYLPADYQLPKIPSPIKRISIDEFSLDETATFEQLKRRALISQTPLHMEALDQNQGFAVYTTYINVEKDGVYQLSFSDLKDRAIVIFNGQRRGVVDRRKKQNYLTVKLAAGSQELEILLENMGHLNYSREMMNDRKGLGTVKLNDKELLNWEIYSIPLEPADIKTLDFSKAEKFSILPLFRRGQFDLAEVGDTMLDMQNWGKGMVWVNGKNLGRYWDIGPQYTLYLPGCWLKEKDNEIIVMDIHPSEHKTVRGVRDPVFGLKVDANLSYKRKKGEQLLLSSGDKVAEGSFDNGDAPQLVHFDEEITSRYLCFEVKSSQSDDNNSAIAEIHLLDVKGNRLDRGSWQLIYADSEDLVAEPCSADNILDEQPVTFWHSQYKGRSQKHPHRLVLDLGGMKKFKTLRYLPRNGANPGKVKDYAIYTSKQLFKGLKK